MPHLVVAPDKFRGTASATQVAGAVAASARVAGWTADEVPMSDGGEGLLEALGGEPEATVVSGPLGNAVEAEWRILPGDPVRAQRAARRWPSRPGWPDRARLRSRSRHGRAE